MMKMMPTMMILPRWAALSLVVVSFTSAFYVGPSTLLLNQQRVASSSSSSTRIFLEDWVADMIDEEIWRQSHKKDFESEWMKKNRAAIVSKLSFDSSSSVSSELMMMDDPKEFLQHAKDVRLAQDDPQRYCADRCLATGNCDVYEDFFRMSAQQVVAFCSDCVVSDGDEPCDIPESFYEEVDGDDDTKLKP